MNKRCKLRPSTEAVTSQSANTTHQHKATAQRLSTRPRLPRSSLLTERQANVCVMTATPRDQHRQP